MSSAQPIILTPQALAHVQTWLTTTNAIGIRLAIKKTGCSGYKYVVELADAELAEDHIFPQTDGTKVLVNSEALALVNGTTIDYVRSGLNSQFRFFNPNETGSCGCGESFTTREQD